MLVGWEVPNVDELTSPFPPNKSVKDPPQGRSGGAGRTRAAAGGESKRARARAPAQQRGLHQESLGDDGVAGPLKGSGCADARRVPSWLLQLLTMTSSTSSTRPGRGAAGPGNEGGTQLFSVISKHDLGELCPEFVGVFLRREPHRG